MKASLKNQIELMAQRNGNKAKPPGKHQTGKINATEINATESTKSMCHYCVIFQWNERIGFLGGRPVDRVSLQSHGIARQFLTYL